MTRVDRVRVGDVLRLERRPVDVELAVEYEQIGVRSFGRGIFHKEPVAGTDLGNKRVFRIEPGDLVISNVFAWEGAIAVASRAEAGKVGSHRFMTFTPIDDRIDVGWTAWFFRSEPGLALMREASPGSAGRNRTLAIGRFEALEIHLPAIEKQVAAVNYLWSVHDAAHRTGTRFAESSAAGVLRMLPTLLDAVVSQTDSRRRTVGELAEFVSDTVHPGDDPAPAESFVGLQHIESHTGRRTGSNPLGPMKGRKFRFRPGDVLYGYLRPYLNKVWVADRHGLCSVDQYVLRPREGVSPELLGYALRGRGILDAAIELTHSLQLPRLRSGLLARLAVPTVDDDVVPQLLRRLDAVRDRVVALAAMRQAQDQACNALVPAALNAVFGPR